MLRRHPVFPFSAPLFLLLGFTAFLLTACTNPQERNSVVAEINGTPILFSELDGVRNILFAPLSGDGTPPDDSTLRSQYSYVLQQLILHELIAQHLQKARISVDEALLVKEELLVQSDYSPGIFMDVLMVQGISPALWHKLMMDRVRMQIFTSQVLRPTISISSSEFELYFNDNKKDFMVPEQWHLFRISSIDKGMVEKARDAFLVSNDASFLNTDQSLSLRDVRMSKDRLPEAIAQAIDAMSPMTASPVTEADGEYVTYVLLEKIPATSLDTIETYKRVEHILMEGKMQVALDAWFAHSLKNAKVRIAQDLLVSSRQDEQSKNVDTIGASVPHIATGGVASANGTAVEGDASVTGASGSESVSGVESNSDSTTETELAPAAVTRQN